MQISPVNTSIQNIYNLKQKRQGIAFGHHPDFIALEKQYNVIASNYFRRGGYYNHVNKQFNDIINTLGLFFDKNKKNKVTMLIGGIAKSQEPYSMLAVIKSLIGRKRINNVLDLYTIDLQSKPDEKTILLQSFYDTPWEPDFVPESFVQEKTVKYGYKNLHRYKVKPDIYKYLSSVYSNPNKALWETRIQEWIKDYSDEKFDIISVNNTLGYICDYETRMQTVRNIFDKLKQNGVFITDPHMTDYQEVFSPDVCDEIYPGIYRKNGELSI